MLLKFEVVVENHIKQVPSIFSLGAINKLIYLKNERVLNEHQALISDDSGK